jgi:hypothetical protein
METNIESVLHPELLGKILQRLAIKDLKMAVLVNRRWREEGEAPVIWAALVSHIHIHPGNINSAVKMLGRRRFQYLQELMVTSQDSLHLLTHCVCRWEKSGSPRSCWRQLTSF